MKGKHNSHVRKLYLPPTSGSKENLKESLYLEKEENPKRSEQTEMKLQKIRKKIDEVKKKEGQNL